MSDAKLFAITGFSGGVSVGLQADSFEEFLDLARQVYGDEEGQAFTEDIFNGLQRQSATATAVSNLQQGGVGVSTVGVANNGVSAPLPQPPVADYPGDCAHGRRVYVDKATSRGPWRRWECAIPWSRGIQGRCSAVTV